MPKGRRLVFGAAWVALSAWLLPHIWTFRKPKPDPEP